MKKDLKLLFPLFYGTILFTVVALVCLAFSFNFYLFAAVAILAVVNIIYTLVSVVNFRKRSYRYLEFLSYSLDVSQRENLDRFPLPSVSLNADGRILWYNDFFKNEILDGKDVIEVPITEIVNGLQPKMALNPQGINVRFKREEYSVFGVRKAIDTQELITLFFKQDTDIKHQAQMFHKVRPCVMQILVDNFDESLVLVKEREKNQILSDIENKIEEIISNFNGIVNKVEKDRFVIILAQENLEKMMETRFPILEEIKEFRYDINSPITLSIGVGCDGDDIAECNTFANQALDMSLGRGGDQATVKTKEGYEFFGESLQSSGGRRTKVKSRLMANTLVEMILGADRVIVMGHKYADFDSVASSLGIYRIAKTLKAKVGIVIDLEKNLSGPLIDKALESKQEDMFLTEDKALNLITDKTLLVVVDTHVKSLVESREVLDKSENIFVIDHHRKVVDFIDTATVSYHEPSASSASEMVTEIAQYIALKYKNLDNLTANALLAGIMLDTKNFTIKTSVRTFEAGAYLKRCGADSPTVKKMFTNSQDVFKAKSRLLADAMIESGCAIAVYESYEECLRLAAPSAADELLQVQDIRASFILYPAGDTINISARSLGEINVQVILEKLGGGGHLTMAGTQMKNMTLNQALEMLKREINTYLNKNKERAQ